MFEIKHLDIFLNHFKVMKQAPSNFLFSILQRFFDDFTGFYVLFVLFEIV